jgi:UPF0042 nucleotide-binding protein
MNEKQLVLLTGMSGAGKSTALRALEDLDFFCVDNLPPLLLPQLVHMLYDSSPQIKRIAICVDVRGGELFSTIIAALKQLEAENIAYEILFLEANDEILIRRYKESRRPHPLMPEGRLTEGIAKERNQLSFLKGKANYILDSSHNNPHQFRESIQSLFQREKDEKRLKVQVLSFGFKYGLPMDADLVFDVRFMPNPHWVAELKERTGISPAVASYVMNWPKSLEFYNKLIDMITFLLPNYKQEGKDQLVLAIGCTGGRHRSVTVAEKITEDLRLLGYQVNVTHRDMEHASGGEERSIQ